MYRTQADVPVSDRIATPKSTRSAALSGLGFSGQPFAGARQGLLGAKCRRRLNGRLNQAEIAGMPQRRQPLVNHNRTSAWVLTACLPLVDRLLTDCWGSKRCVVRKFSDSLPWPP